MTEEEYLLIIRNYGNLRECAVDLICKRIPTREELNLDIYPIFSDDQVLFDVREIFGESTETCYKYENLSLSVEELLESYNKGYEVC